MSITQITTSDIENLAVTEPKLEYQPYCPARVATTGNVILNGISTIDNVLLQDEDIVLARLQNSTSDNGLYLVRSSGNWIKKGPTVPGTLVGVRQGSQNGLSMWTVRDDMVTWDEFSLSGDGGSSGFSGFSGFSATSGYSGVSGFSGTFQHSGFSGTITEVCGFSCYLGQLAIEYITKTYSDGYLLGFSQWS
jgi:hypothetical protein